MAWTQLALTPDTSSTDLIMLVFSTGQVILRAAPYGQCAALAPPKKPTGWHSVASKAVKTCIQQADQPATE